MMGISSMVVSVGIPTRNRAALLARAMESVVTQDYPHIELVISDNGSTDETEAVCCEAALRHPCIRYIRQSQDIGPTANFRAALRAATAECFIWLSDDDWLEPNYLSTCIQALTTTEGAIAAS